MNIHVSAEIQEKYKCLEFRGKPFRLKNKTLIQCQHRTLGSTLHYCFEDDFAWFGYIEQIPEQQLPYCKVN